MVTGRFPGLVSAKPKPPRQLLSRPRSHSAPWAAGAPGPQSPRVPVQPAWSSSSLSSNEEPLTVENHLCGGFQSGS